MTRTISMWIGALLFAGAAPVFAQEIGTAPGKLEVTIVPAGGTFFVSKGASPDFGSYSYGGALTFNLNRFVGIEGEVTGSAGVTQDLQLGGGIANLKTPNSVSYTGNLVVSATTGHSVVPFVTGGVGGLTMFRETGLAISNDATFLTGNVGGGIKWYAPNRRWGLRGDYRLLAVQSKDDAPAFFGRDARYAHRVYVGVVVNAVR